MKSCLFAFLGALVLVGALPARVTAAAPRTIAFQGMLYSATGAHLADGPYNVTFRLYDALTGGNLLWAEAKTVVESKGGFVTALGDTTAFPAAVLFDKPYWLSVQIGADAAMTPRLALGAMPYALSLSLPFAGGASTASPSAALAITNASDGTGVGGYSTNGYGVEAISTNANGLRVYGLRDGVVVNASNGAAVSAEGGSFGVNAISRAALGVGVYGRSDAYIGVDGESSDGNGVFGYSLNSNGVTGQADSVNGFAVYGRNYASGPSVGGYFKPGSNGVGIFAGDWGWFGSAAIETDLTSAGTHIYCAENGTGVFYVYGGGAVHALSYGSLSDARYKQRIATLADPLETVLKLRGVSFEWNPDAGRSFPAGRQIGFVAQEVQKVLPELVSTDDKGYLSVEYSNVVPILVEGLKEQQRQIEDLKLENSWVRREKDKQVATLQKQGASMEQRVKRVEERLDRLLHGGS